MTVNDDVKKLLQDSRDYLDGKTDVNEASQKLLKEVQDLQKKGKWWEAVREARWLGGWHFDAVPSVKTEWSEDENLTTQLIISPSIYDLQGMGKGREIVIQQPRKDSPISVQVGHKPMFQEFHIDRQGTINMADDDKPIIDVTKPHSVGNEHDDRTGSIYRELYAPDEAARLSQLSDQVVARKPGATEQLRDELWRANDQFGFERQKVFQLYQKMATSPILEADEKTGLLQMKDPVSPAKPGSELFATPKDTLQSIAPAVMRLPEIGAFDMLTLSMAALDPRDLLKMMKDNGDGTCTVTFPGAPGKPVTVPIPKAEATRGSEEHRGSLPNVLQAAYEQYLRQNVLGFASLSSSAIAARDQEPDAADRAFHLLIASAPAHDHTASGGFDSYVTLGLESQSKLGQKLESAVNERRPGLIYDRQSKEYKGIVDYDPVNEVLYYSDGFILNDRSLDEISPHFIGPGYAFSVNDVYLKPSK